MGSEGVGQGGEETLRFVATGLVLLVSLSKTTLRHQEQLVNFFTFTTFLGSHTSISVQQENSQQHPVISATGKIVCLYIYISLSA